MYIASLIIFVCVHAIAVAGMSLLTGYTGIFSIGHAGFMAIGGYTSVVAYTYLHVPYLLALFLGGLCAVLISVIIGYPALRNKMEGDAFAIVMLGFVAVVRVSISNIKPVLNGAVGISGIPMKSTLPVVVIWTVFMLYMMRNLMKSHYGKNCLAVQQQEPAAEMVGVDLLKTKLRSLMISAFYCGIAGGLFTFYATFISPMSFAETKSNDLVAAVVLGGMGSLSGPVMAMAVLVLLPEILRFLSTWRLVFYGLSFVVIMRFRPEGLFGYKEVSFRWIKRVFRKLRRKTDGSNSAA